MNDRFMLRLLPSGDIDIIKIEEGNRSYQCVYHKTYNPDETISNNLFHAYIEWERLTGIYEERQN